MKQNMVGQKYGKLLIKQYSHKNTNWQSYYIVMCDCGNESTVRGSHLKNGSIKQCIHCSNKNKQLDLTGLKFNRLIVLNKIDKKWNCQCSCGKFIKVQTNNLRNSHTQSCGCLRLDKIRKNPTESSLNQLYSNYKRHAKNRKLEWKLNKDEFKRITSKNCNYCGIEPKQVQKHPDNFHNYIYNGVDRIDNNVGYLLQNSVPCCKICNWCKKNYTEKEFLDWIERVYGYRIARTII